MTIVVDSLANPGAVVLFCCCNDLLSLRIISFERVRSSRLEFFRLSKSNFEFSNSAAFALPFAAPLFRVRIEESKQGRGSEADRFDFSIMNSITVCLDIKVTLLRQAVACYHARAWKADG